jgi:hypothetical protein
LNAVERTDRFLVFKLFKKNQWGLISAIAKVKPEICSNAYYFDNFSQRSNLLYEAMSEEQWDNAKKLLASCGQIILEDSIKGGAVASEINLPLLHAVKEKQVELVKFIISELMKVNPTDQSKFKSFLAIKSNFNNHTALSLAKQLGEQEIVRLLEEAGAEK